MNENVLIKKMEESEQKAFDSLARYKFYMFGYWSASWVKYNQLAFEMGIIQKKNENPFKDLVNLAKNKRSENLKTAILNEAEDRGFNKDYLNKKLEVIIS